LESTHKICREGKVLKKESGQAFSKKGEWENVSTEQVIPKLTGVFPAVMGKKGPGGKK